MLVLSRETDKKIIVTIPPSAVPRQMEILVIRCTPGRCRLGITAPPDIKINRDEVQNAIDAEELNYRP